MKHHLAATKSVELHLQSQCSFRTADKFGHLTWSLHDFQDSVWFRRQECLSCNVQTALFHSNLSEKIERPLQDWHVSQATHYEAAEKSAALQKPWGTRGIHGDAVV